MRSLALLGTLIVLVWLSSIALLYTLDVLVVTAVKESWVRTLFGLLAFAVWMFGWYMVIMAFSRKLITGWARRVSGKA